MRRAGDVCFSQVFRDGSGKMLFMLQVCFLVVYCGKVSNRNIYCDLFFPWSLKVLLSEVVLIEFIKLTG